MSKTATSFLFAAVAMCLAVFGILDPASAAVVFNPVIGVSGELTDNFYRSQNNTKSVYTFKVSPGIHIGYETDKSKAEVTYNLHIVMYQAQDDDVNADDDNYIGHDFLFEGHYKPSEKLQIGLSDDFIYTRESAYADRFSEAEARDLYWRNRIKPEVTYNLFEKGSVTLAYRNEVLRYTDIQDFRFGKEDSIEHRGILVLTYNLSPRSYLDLENQIWHRDYDGESVSDYDAYQVQLIYRHELTSMLKAHIGMGYQWRVFEVATLDDWDDWMMTGGLSGEFAKTKVFAEIERNINDFATGDGYLTAWRFNFAGEREWGHLITQLSGWYQKADYYEQEREDDSYNISAGVGYKFLDDQLTVMFNYAYTNRESNIDGFDYSENQFFLTIRGEF